MNNIPITIHPLQRLTERGLHFYTIIRSIEAISGIILLLFTAIALFWSNSSYSESYQHFLHTPFALMVGGWHISTDLHFLINDVLMTIFFLVIGVEVRREIHDGALSNFKMASLPIIAACGGVILPALIFMMVSWPIGEIHRGWAIPTATDIAFAVGILALLGKFVPPAARIFLLTLAIIDDIIAVLIIAVFYSAGLDYSALSYVLIGFFIIFLFQRMGIYAFFPYVFPAILIWLGLFKVGIHPSLAGVILGLVTPIMPRPHSISALEQAEIALREIKEECDPIAVNKLRLAHRELHSPVERVSYHLAPWVAFCIMPLFALANAGVNLSSLNLNYTGTDHIVIGIVAALVLGKPIGIFLITWLCIRLNIGKLSKGMNYQWLFLIGCLGGIGFTMSIFTANLAFYENKLLLDTAKFAILIGSFIAAVIGLIIGIYIKKKSKNNDLHLSV